MEGLSAVIVIDAREIDEPVTRDEKLALALLYSEPDETLIEHQRGCPADGTYLECRCTPTTYRLGSKA